MKLHQPETFLHAPLEKNLLLTAGHVQHSSGKHTEGAIEKKPFPLQSLLIEGTRQEHLEFIQASLAKIGLPGVSSFPASGNIYRFNPSPLKIPASLQQAADIPQANHDGGSPIARNHDHQYRKEGKHRSAPAAKIIPTMGTVMVWI